MAARRSPQADAAHTGVPSNADRATQDNPQEDWGEPAGEAAYGANHATRPNKTEAERGQGRRTIERNREIVKGRLYR